MVQDDCRLFQNASVCEPWHKYDHYMVLGFLHSDSHQKQYRYVEQRRRSLLCPLKTKTQEDQWFTELRTAIPKPPPWDKQINVWIFEAMCNLVDTRVVEWRSHH